MEKVIKTSNKTVKATSKGKAKSSRTPNISTPPFVEQSISPVRPVPMNSATHSKNDS